jgi:hypothetical protein
VSHSSLIHSRPKAEQIAALKTGKKERIRPPATHQLQNAQEIPLAKSASEQE